MRERAGTTGGDRDSDDNAVDDAPAIRASNGTLEQRNDALAAPRQQPASIRLSLIFRRQPRMFPVRDASAYFRPLNRAVRPVLPHVAVRQCSTCHCALRYGAVPQLLEGGRLERRRWGQGRRVPTPRTRRRAVASARVYRDSGTRRCTMQAGGAVPLGAPPGAPLDSVGGAPFRPGTLKRARRAHNPAPLRRPKVTPRNSATPSGRLFSVERAARCELLESSAPTCGRSFRCA